GGVQVSPQGLVVREQRLLRLDVLRERVEYLPGHDGRLGQPPSRALRMWARHCSSLGEKRASAAVRTGCAERCRWSWSVCRLTTSAASSSCVRSVTFFTNSHSQSGDFGFFARRLSISVRTA